MKNNLILDYGVGFALPDWTREFVSKIPQNFRRNDLTYMRIAVDLLNRQLELKTGGPFAALIVDNESGELLSVGLNQVVGSSDPTAHAEITAIRLACSLKSNFNLQGMATLYTTSQPCVMCLGATVWSGVGRVVFGATAEKTERITGFDEGIIPDDWREQLKKRNIQVDEGVLREEVCEALQRYKTDGGTIYNGTRPD